MLCVPFDVPCQGGSRKGRCPLSPSHSLEKAIDRILISFQLNGIAAPFAKEYDIQADAKLSDSSAWIETNFRHISPD